jgi:hypothetical protein
MSIAEAKAVVFVSATFNSAEFRSMLFILEDYSSVTVFLESLVMFRAVSARFSYF